MQDKFKKASQDRYSDDLFGDKEHHEKSVENKGFEIVNSKMYTFNQKKKRYTYNISLSDFFFFFFANLYCF